MSWKNLLGNLIWITIWWSELCMAWWCHLIYVNLALPSFWIVRYLAIHIHLEYPKQINKLYTQRINAKPNQGYMRSMEAGKVIRFVLCERGENGAVLPQEKGKWSCRMETGWEHGQCFCTSGPFAHHIRHCHWLVVLLPLQRLQGSAPYHSLQLSAIPLLVARLLHLLHLFIFYYGKAQLSRFQTMTPTAFA